LRMGEEQTPHPTHPSMHPPTHQPEPPHTPDAHCAITPPPLLHCSSRAPRVNAPTTLGQGTD